MKNKDIDQTKNGKEETKNGPPGPNPEIEQKQKTQKRNKKKVRKKGQYQTQEIRLIFLLLLWQTSKGKRENKTKEENQPLENKPQVRKIRLSSRKNREGRRQRKTPTRNAKQGRKRKRREEKWNTKRESLKHPKTTQQKNCTKHRAFQTGKSRETRWAAEKGKGGSKTKTNTRTYTTRKQRMQTTKENLQGDTKTWPQPRLIMKQKHNTARNTHPKKTKRNEKIHKGKTKNIHWRARLGLWW